MINRNRKSSRNVLETDPSLTSLLTNPDTTDHEVWAQIIPLVFRDLHIMAKRALARERPNHTLQPTALVHEAFLRLVEQKGGAWQNRQEFFGAAARTIRLVLIDHERARRRLKRGGTRQRQPLSDDLLPILDTSVDLIALDDALKQLAAADPVRARVVELRYFAGLTIEQTAEVMEVSVPTVVRYWRLARTWLFRELNDE